MAENKRIRKNMANMGITLAIGVVYILSTPFLQAEASSLQPPGIDQDLPVGKSGISRAASPDPFTEPEEDVFYAGFRNHSWKIPEEVIKTNDIWIEIDLTQQMLYAYRGNQVISGFVVSSGTRSYKTVTGIYKIYAKYPAIDMRGPGYDLADVPYSIFFHKGYAIHGTYWHSNFGRPMSRGCVNMVTEEAAWLYENAPVGTYVIVYY